ncbi:MAG: SCO family protein [Burkholderiales bacterium]|nr:SCO family protein [Burkholderiales bacterium]
MPGAGALAFAATLALGAGAFCAESVAGESVERLEQRLRERAIPDIPLRLADGRTAAISTLGQQRPLLVTLFYTRCSGVCTPFLLWVRDALNEAGGLGTDYDVLALSFDDADSVRDLQAQAAALGLANEPGWTLAVAERDAVARIAGALDFWYRADPATGQFDHSALLVAVDQGRVVRALLDSTTGNRRLREMTWELRGRFIPFYRTADGGALRCFAFDARSGEVSFDWGMLLLAAPALAALALVAVLFGVTSRHRAA